MAKVLDNIEIVITGSETAPTTCVRRYVVKDSVNAELKTKKTNEVARPDFDKTFHDAGTVGEFWKDLVDQIKTDERI